MNASHEHTPLSGSTPKEPKGSHRHGWMMIPCCIPMLVVAVALVAAGVVSPGFLVVAIGCTVIMALMMAGLSRGDHCA
jgi:hypothetical protein